jgi:hypothetical protein
LSKRYGLYDTKDNLWLGGDDGPKSFGEGDVLPNGKVLDDNGAYVFARICSEVVGHTVGWSDDPDSIHRVEVRELPEGGPWSKHDEIKKVMTEAEVLKRKERGSLL